MNTTRHTESVEVILKDQRRRRWSLREKAALVRRTYEPGMSVSLVARQEGVAASLMQRDLDFFCHAPPGPRRGVVEHFLNDVERVVGARVHARTLLDGFQAFEDSDRTFGVIA